MIWHSDSFSGKLCFLSHAVVANKQYVYDCLENAIKIQFHQNLIISKLVIIIEKFSSLKKRVLNVNWSSWNPKVSEIRDLISQFPVDCLSKSDRSSLLHMSAFSSREITDSAWEEWTIIVVIKCVRLPSRKVGWGAFTSRSSSSRALPPRSFRGCRATSASSS